MPPWDHLSILLGREGRVSELVEVDGMKLACCRPPPPIVHGAKQVVKVGFGHGAYAHGTLLVGWVHGYEAPV